MSGIEQRPRCASQHMSEIVAGLQYDVGYDFVLGAALMCALWLIFERTSFGAQLRAAVLAASA